MTEPVVITQQATGVATLTLNRPAARNALNRPLIAALTDELARYAAEVGLRALIVTGAGERAFCAGADLVERRTMRPEELSAHTAAIDDLAHALAEFPAPVIAAVRGYALAGGAELAIACDLRVAAEDAILGFPEVKVGVFPGAGGVVRLPRLVGAGAARDLLYTGRQIGASEALRIGLVDRVVQSEKVMAEARALAEQIAENAPLAVRAVKQALTASHGRPEEEAHRVVGQHRRPLDATADYAEGLAAFNERRRPVFRGD